MRREGGDGFGSCAVGGAWWFGEGEEGVRECVARRGGRVTVDGEEGVDCDDEDCEG